MWRDLYSECTFGNLQCNHARIILYLNGVDHREYYYLIPEVVTTPVLYTVKCARELTL